MPVQPIRKKRDREFSPPHSPVKKIKPIQSNSISTYIISYGNNGIIKNIRDIPIYIDSITLSDRNRANKTYQITVENKKVTSEEEIQQPTAIRIGASANLFATTQPSNYTEQLLDQLVGQFNNPSNCSTSNSPDDATGFTNMPSLPFPI